MNHWHVLDHYTGDDAIYRTEKRAAMRQWVRRHGGEPIVEVVCCSENCPMTEPVQVCVCSHARHEHHASAGCVVLDRSSREDENVFCACRAFTLAGEQPALFEEDAP